MKEFVTDMKQKETGVEIQLSNGVEKEKIDRMAVRCAPGGPGCNSNCCDSDFRTAIEGIDVSGMDDNVTMHLRGAITATKVVEVMSKCDCYNEDL
jgi:hypothetical protein